MCTSHGYKSMCGQESIDVIRSHSSNTAMLTSIGPEPNKSHLFIQDKGKYFMHQSLHSTQCYTCTRTLKCVVTRHLGGVSGRLSLHNISSE